MDSAAAGTTEGGGTDAVTTTATCACCGMDEECTPRYVARVAAQFGGAWVCGLCDEAIKDEAVRRGVGLEAARRAHAEFVVSAARAGAGSGPAVQVVRALLQLLKKVIAAAPAGAAAVLPPATPAPHDLHVGNNHDLISFESCM